MKIEKELITQVIHKFNELFICKRKKYLILKPNGKYIQVNHENSENFTMLNDNHIKRHLQGKETIGVFAGEYNTMFICFDIDFHDPSLAKWYTYKLIDTLIEIGIPSKYIYISTSGNKGYHVDIYFNKMIEPEKSKVFFDLVINHGQLYSNDGQIEFRPNGTQGLKLPLGINFKNKDTKINKCWYVDYNKGLEPIKRYEYILEIEQINIDIIKNIIESFTDLTMEENPKSKQEGLKVEFNKDYLDIKHNTLPIYKINVDPNATIEAAISLEEKGLQFKGTRHNSLFLLCRYYKYLGYSQNENIQLLNEWIIKQNNKYYITSIKESIKDIKEINSYIYDNDISLTDTNKEIKITYSEMLNILKATNMNDKLIAYSMLIHSKRYANKNGIFYMTYKQIALATGFNERTAIRNINKLEELKIIEIVERNINAGNSKNKFKKPNKYRFIEMESDIKIEITYNNEYVNNTSIDDILTTSIIGMFNFEGVTNVNDLKLLVPKRQYYTYKNIIDCSTNSLTDFPNDK